jgi:hypothetical protein
MSSSLGFTDAVGQLKVNTGAVVANAFRGGIAFDVNGRAFVTTVVSAGDVYVGGLRASGAGALVVSSPAGPSQPYIYVNGLPTSKVDSSLIRTVDGVILATAPYVAGFRADDTNGVYMTIL